MAAYRAPHPVMTALRRGVPLTLLVDLCDPAGPDSRAIFTHELGDLSWLRELAYPGGDQPAAVESTAS